MYFKILGLFIAIAFIGKAVSALAFPGRFYRARQQQYASVTPSPKLFIAPAVVGVLTAVAWFATFFHYAPWGFLVTAVLTALCVPAVHHLSCWGTHRQIMLQTVTSAKVWWFDCTLLAAGLAFAALAILVY